MAAGAADPGRAVTLDELIARRDRLRRARFNGVATVSIDGEEVTKALAQLAGHDGGLGHRQRPPDDPSLAAAAA